MCWCVGIFTNHPQMGGGALDFIKSCSMLPSRVTLPSPKAAKGYVVFLLPYGSVIS